MKLKDMEIKPREKLIKYGVETLSNSELLAILLNTGYKDLDVLELSEDIIFSIGKINNFIDFSYQELLEIKGIGVKKALTIISAIEFGKRILTRKDEILTFKEPLDIFNYMKDDVILSKQEQFYVVYIDGQANIIEKRLITIGNINSVHCDVSEIFKWYYKYKAVGFYLIHNHPSMNPTPSDEDTKVTKKVLEMCRVLNIYFLDHVIIGNGYFSYAKNTNLFRKLKDQELKIDLDFLSVNKL